MQELIQVGVKFAMIGGFVLGAVIGIVLIAVGLANFGRRSDLREVMDQGGGAAPFMKGELKGTDHEAHGTVGRGLNLWVDKTGKLQASKKSQAIL